MGNELRVGTRYDERSGVSRVLDLVVYGGSLEVRCKMGERVVGLDHRPVEAEVEMVEWKIEEMGWKKGKVD